MTTPKPIFEDEDFLAHGVRRLSIDPHTGQKMVDASGKVLEYRDVMYRTETGFPIGISISDMFGKFFYSATLGGFFPVEFASVPLLASSIHYGEGAFEGMHAISTKYGTGYVAPQHNGARLGYSAETLQLGFLKQLIELSLSGYNLTAEQQFTASEFYRNAWATSRANLGSFVGTKGDSTMHVQYPDFVRVATDMGADHLLLDVRTFVSIANALTFVNQLVAFDDFAACPRKVEGAYGRPTIYYGNAFREDALRQLKISLTGRSMEFAMFHLPWKQYLNEKDYETGLTVLIAPHPRIGSDMPNGKDSGCYLNSHWNIDTMNIVKAMAIQALQSEPDGERRRNLEVLSRLGEVLVKNSRDGRFVEGSAENLFFLVQDGGKVIAYTPSTADGHLPGTNWARFIDTLERSGIRVVYKSLNYEEIKALNGKGDLLGVLFTGTGADVIHIRTLVNLPQLPNLCAMTTFSWENLRHSLTMRARPLLDEMETIHINPGPDGQPIKHPLIDDLFLRHKLRMVEELFTPVYQIDWSALANAMRIDVGDIARTSNEKALVNRGYFEARPNELSKTEIKDRYLACARLMAHAMDAQFRSAFGSRHNAMKALKL